MGQFWQSLNQFGQYLQNNPITEIGSFLASVAMIYGIIKRLSRSTKGLFSKTRQYQINSKVQLSSSSIGNLLAWTLLIIAMILLVISTILLLYPKEDTVLQSTVIIVV